MECMIPRKVIVISDIAKNKSLTAKNNDRCNKSQSWLSTSKTKQIEHKGDAIMKIEKQPNEKVKDTNKLSPL